MADTDLNYRDIFQVLYGHPAGQEPGELPVIKGMAIELAKVAHKTAAPFIKQIRIEGAKAGLSKDGIQYLYWAIFDSQKTWPSLPEKSRQALILFTTISKIEGGIPNYTNNLPVLDTGDEILVDHAIERVAVWILTVMIPFFKKEWTGIVSNGLRLLPMRKDVKWLDARFREELLQRPHTLFENIILFFIMTLIT